MPETIELKYIANLEEFKKQTEEIEKIAEALEAKLKSLEIKITIEAVSIPEATS